MSLLFCPAEESCIFQYGIDMFDKDVYIPGRYPPTSSNKSNAQSLFDASSVRQPLISVNKVLLFSYFAYPLGKEDSFNVFLTLQFPSRSQLLESLLLSNHRYLNIVFDQKFIMTVTKYIPLGLFLIPVNRDQPCIDINIGRK